VATKLISIEALYSFATVVEMESFTRASKHIGRSQPAISMQLKKLESQLELELFTRVNGALELTGPGRLLYEHAQQVLGLNDKVLQTLQGQLLSGQLTFGMPSEFASQWLPKVLGRFTRAYPDVALDVSCALSRDLQREDQRKRYDLTLTLSRPATSELKDELVWVGANREPVAASSRLKLVAAPNGCIYREAALSALQKAGQPALVSYTNADFSGLLAAVQQGLGITVLAKSTVPEGLMILEKGLPKLGDIGIHLNFGDTKKDAATKLAEYMREALQAL